MIILAIIGIILALCIAAKCEQRAEETYQKEMDQWKIEMRKRHGDRWRAED